MESAQSPGFLNLIVLIIFSLPLGATAYILAKQKGRNTVLWTILGLIPMINFFCMWYFSGATNLIIEKKIDKLLEDNAEKKSV